LYVRTRLAAALLCSLSIATVAALAASSASAQLRIGIGDESASLFSNQWFNALGVSQTRLITPYNVALASPSADDEWMTAAYLDKQQIVVAFNPASSSRCPGSPCVAPSAPQYTKAFAAFHKRYPFVKMFQPWNEINSLTQPTHSNPALVVTYYKIVKRLCSACTVTGGDIEDLVKGPGVPAAIDEVNYSKALLAAYKRAHVATPQVWGLHNYVDVNYTRSTGTRNALATLPGQLWLSETGGIAKFVLSSGKVRLKYDLNRQASATKWMMQLALSNRRITRIFEYDMFYAPANRFDSSLLGPDGSPRKAYYVLQAHYLKYFT
jgi:hypothetical protein